MVEPNGGGEFRSLRITGEVEIDARPEATADKRADECLITIDGRKFWFPREAADEFADLIPVFVNHVMDRVQDAVRRLP
jgi:hypothetical protein